MSEDIAARFARDTAGHELTVLHDDGLYRHLRFMQPRPGSSCYWFELITVPGALIFRGDGESFVFSRLDDMFQFFRSGIRKDGSIHINPGYWLEKLTSDRNACMQYSEKLFTQRVAEYLAECEEDTPGVTAAWGKHLGEFSGDYDTSSEGSARQALNDFEFLPAGDAGRPFTFEDTWEWSFRDYDWWFLWACHAICWGIQRYDAAKAEQAAQAVRAARPGVRELVEDLISHSGFAGSCWIVPSPTRWALLLPREDGPLYFTQSRQRSTVDEAVALGLVRLGELEPLPEHSQAPQWLIRKVPQPFEGRRITATGGAR